jgi:hypothetical protein
MSTVDGALKKEGHTGSVILNRSGEELEILITGTSFVKYCPLSQANPCSVAGSDVAAGTELTACESKFTPVFRRSCNCNKAETDIVTNSNGCANALVTRFFAGVPRGSRCKCYYAKQVRHRTQTPPSYAL